MILSDGKSGHRDAATSCSGANARKGGYEYETSKLIGWGSGAEVIPEDWNMVSRTLKKLFFFSQKG